MTPDLFEPFLTLGSPALVGMRTNAQAFVADFQSLNRKPRWLSLLGSSGAGKTMLARIVLAEAKRFTETHPYTVNNYEERRIRRVKFGTWPKIVKRLRQGDFDIMEEFKSAWLTIIDDIGAEHNAQSSFIPAELYDLLNDRLGKWTLLTSNLSLEDIANQIDRRIASRLRRDGSSVLEIKVADFATRKVE